MGMKSRETMMNLLEQRTQQKNGLKKDVRQYKFRRMYRAKEEDEQGIEEEKQM